MGEDALQYDSESKITTHPSIDSEDLYLRHTGEIYHERPTIPARVDLIKESVYNQYGDSYQYYFENKTTTQVE